MNVEKVFQFLKKKMRKEDLYIFGTVFLVGLINFFYLLTHHVLSPDGLAYGPIYKSNGWEVDLGRPLLLVIDRLRGGLVNPPVILFTSFIIISLSVLLVTRIFSIKKPIPIILLSILFILFPVLSESALFIYCMDSYSIALFFSILSIYFIQKKKPIWSIFFMIGSLSLYQAYISVTLTGVFVLYLMDILEKKDSLKDFIKNLVIVFLGLLSYLILLKIGMAIFGRNLADYKGASSFGIDTILSLPRSIFHAYQDFYSYFFLDSVIYNHYYYRHIMNLLITITLFTVLFIKGRNLKISSILLGIGTILLFPLACNIMDLIACDTTINLVTGIGFIMFYVFCLVVFDRYISNLNWKTFSFVLLGVLAYSFLLSNNGTFMAREQTYLNYYSQMSTYLQKAKNLEDYQEDMPWVFSDIIRYQADLAKTSNGYLALDYETYDNFFGELETCIFVDRYFGERMIMAEYDLYQAVGETEEFQEMELGEVRIIKGAIVVKNSPELAF